MFGAVFVIVSLVVFLGILGGLLLHKIVSWYIEGAVGALVCLLIAGLYMGLVFSIVTLRLPAAAVILVLLVGIALLSRCREYAADRRFRDDQIGSYREAIARDPRNLAARSRLVDVLQRTGRLHEAVAEQSMLVQMSPRDLAEIHRLRRLTEEYEERRSPPITCPSCGHANPPERTRCENCEGHLRLISEIRRWLTKGGLKQIAVTWAVTVSVLTIAMFTLTMLSLPIRIAAVALVLIIVILAEMLYAYRAL